MEAWFTAGLAALGWAELGGAYAYVSVVDGPTASEYLASLLGDTPASLSFIEQYLSHRQRLVGRGGPGVGAVTGAGGGGVAGAPAAASPAAAVAADSAGPQPSRWQADGRPLNCIRCGWVHTVPNRDGLCLFCASPLLSDGGVSAAAEPGGEEASAAAATAKPHPLAGGATPTPAAAAVARVAVAVATGEEGGSGGAGGGGGAADTVADISVIGGASGLPNSGAAAAAANGTVGVVGLPPLAGASLAVGEITLPGRGGGASTGVLANAGLGAPPPRFLITPAALEALLGAPAAAVAITAAGGS
ncbi:hypothetical protein I4F81_010945 [Pyropia yezoensis]|uniref:Uncharacterized protein n=1 Tax=Pyropia yezoensis TaxID=2788 RepID=A0ACC3CF58_PYRYE|nr:hypothetical protein I4F81_010945 [Neopyropia yezoensis]